MGTISTYEAGVRFSVEVGRSFSIDGRTDVPISSEDMVLGQREVSVRPDLDFEEVEEGEGSEDLMHLVDGDLVFLDVY